MIEFGGGTYIGECINPKGTEGTRIVIGKKWLIYHLCAMVSANHSTAVSSFVIDRGHNQRRTGISLGDDVWLRTGLAVLPGSTIWGGAIIGANSVVNGFVPMREILAGSTERNIGSRGRAR